MSNIGSLTAKKANTFLYNERWGIKLFCHYYRCTEEEIEQHFHLLWKRVQDFDKKWSKLLENERNNMGNTADKLSTKDRISKLRNLILSNKRQVDSKRTEIENLREEIKKLTDQTESYAIELSDLLTQSQKIVFVVSSLGRIESPQGDTINFADNSDKINSIIVDEVFPLLLNSSFDWKSANMELYSSIIKTVARCLYVLSDLKEQGIETPVEFEFTLDEPLVKQVFEFVCKRRDDNTFIS